MTGWGCRKPRAPQSVCRNKTNSSLEEEEEVMSGEEERRRREEMKVERMREREVRKKVSERGKSNFLQPSHLFDCDE